MHDTCAECPNERQMKLVASVGPALSSCTHFFPEPEPLIQSTETALLFRLSQFRVNYPAFGNNNQPRYVMITLYSLTHIDIVMIAAVKPYKHHSYSMLRFQNRPSQ